MRVYSGSYDSAEDSQLGFSAFLTNFTPFAIDISILFYQPLIVSTGSEPDRIEVDVNKGFIVDE